MIDRVFFRRSNFFNAIACIRRISDAVTCGRQVASDRCLPFLPPVIIRTEIRRYYRATNLADSTAFSGRNRRPRHYRFIREHGRITIHVDHGIERVLRTLVVADT